MGALFYHKSILTHRLFPIALTSVEESIGIGVAVSMLEATWDAIDGTPAVAVKDTPSFCIALASASGRSARTTVRIRPVVALNVLKGVS